MPSFPCPAEALASGWASSGHSSACSSSLTLIGTGADGCFGCVSLLEPALSKHLGTCCFLPFCRPGRRSLRWLLGAQHVTSISLLSGIGVNCGEGEAELLLRPGCRALNKRGSPLGSFWSWGLSVWKHTQLLSGYVPSRKLIIIQGCLQDLLQYAPLRSAARREPAQVVR